MFECIWINVGIQCYVPPMYIEPCTYKSTWLKTSVAASVAGYHMSMRDSSSALCGLQRSIYMMSKSNYSY